MCHINGYDTKIKLKVQLLILFPFYVILLVLLSLHNFSFVPVHALESISWEK